MSTNTADNSHTPAVVIREADSGDLDRLRRLAQRDSSRVPAGTLLVAEADGELLAAISLADRAVIADPFHPTAGLVALLEMRASEVQGARSKPLRLIARTPSAAPSALRQAA